MQVLKRDDIVLVPARVTGFSTGGSDVNLETIPGMVRIYGVPVDSVSVATFTLEVGDRVSLSDVEVDIATVHGATADEVWVRRDGDDKSITVSRSDVKSRRCTEVDNA